MTTAVTKAASAAQHAAHTISRAKAPDPIKAHRKNSSSKCAHIDEVWSKFGTSVSVSTVSASCSSLFAHVACHWLAHTRRKTMQLSLSAEHDKTRTVTDLAWAMMSARLKPIIWS